MKKLLLSLAALMLCLSASAQSQTQASGQQGSQTSGQQRNRRPVPQEDEWYFGVTAGYHGSKLLYSDLDKELFPKNHYVGSGAFSVFARKSFGKDLNFMVRPEISVLNRGGKLSHILDVNDYYELNGLKDVVYRIKTHYVDFRVPLMYQFGKKNSSLRPYVFVAPILGFANGGNISYERQREAIDANNAYNYTGVNVDVTKANMNSVYFAGGAGLGLDWYFNVSRNRCFLGLEANYEYGFTNTYGNDNDAEVKIFVNPNGKVVEGSRRMHGFEVKLTVGVPLSIFTKKPAYNNNSRRSDSNRSRNYNGGDGNYVRPTADNAAASNIFADNNANNNYERCYTLEEINQMLINGENVKGKTICAIDDVINFEFNESKINPESYPYLDQLARTLKLTGAEVEIKGYCDNIGTEEVNNRLSRDRAIAVYNYLVAQGVPRNRLTYTGYGYTHPVADNDTEEGRRQNRRVEFEIK